MTHQNKIRPAARSAGQLAGLHQDQVAALPAMGMTPTGRQPPELVFPYHHAFLRGHGKSWFARDWKMWQQLPDDGQAEIRRAVQAFIKSIR